MLTPSGYVSVVGPPCGGGGSLGSREGHLLIGKLVVQSVATPKCLGVEESSA